MIKLLHDGMIIREVCLVYAGEANCLSVEDSSVKEVAVHNDFASLSRSKTPHWQSFAQLPFSESRISEIRALNETRAGTINKKLLAVSNTTERTSRGLGDCYFLSTYDGHTRVTDLDAQPMQGSGVGGWKSGVSWKEHNIDLVLRPTCYVVGVGVGGIEVVDWKSARVLQRVGVVDGTCRVVGKSGGLVCVVEGRGKSGGCVIVYFEEGKEGGSGVPGYLMLGKGVRPESGDSFSSQN
jgi:hypothetical protein